MQARALIIGALLALAARPASATAAPTAAPSNQPVASEKAFVQAIQRDLPARFATPAAAVRAGYLRYTDADDTGAISYANRHWVSQDWRHPSQLWYDKDGHLLGADFSVLKSGAQPRPSIWGVLPSRWIEQEAHLHYAVDAPNGTVKYGYIDPAAKIEAVHGNPVAPTAADIVAMKLAPSRSDVRFVFLFPDIWDLVVWTKPNPNGAFADANPLVKR